MFDGMEPLVLQLPAIVKAVADEKGQRRVAVEASNEQVDDEGDIITQKSLLDARPGFLAQGALDINHLSEIGGRYGLNPSDWIVGVPTEVLDIGKSRTEVRGILHAAQPGKISKADELWDGLTRDPPVPWRASIFGWPQRGGGFIDVRTAKCAEYPDAKRYVVKAIDWRSLAFTRTPVNNAITGTARVMTMKAFLEGLVADGIVKGPGSMEVAMPIGAMESGGAFLVPRNRMELLAHHDGHVGRGECACCESTGYGRSIAGFRQHFMGCAGLDYGTADILALAMMQALKHR